MVIAVIVCDHICSCLKESDVSWDEMRIMERGGGVIVVLFLDGIYDVLLEYVEYIKYFNYSMVTTGTG
jgi:hypothetical protein